MSEPIRIVHNIASLHFGGSQAFVMNIYNNIDRKKVQFDFVVIPEERKDLYELIESMGGIYLSARGIMEKIIFLTVNGGMISLWNTQNIM